MTTGKAVYYEYDSLGRLIHSYQIDNGTVQQRTEHLYDSENRLTSQSWQLGDTRYKESYKYNANDGSLTTVNLDGMVGYAYLYDSLKRLNAQYNWLYGRFYTYRTNNGNQATQIASIDYAKRDGGTGFTEFKLGYAYDAAGNITKITGTTRTDQSASYTYDNQGQLTKEVNTNGTYNYTYDTYGNIRSVSGAESHTYTYGDSEWLDLLTAYDGKSITYDAIGNPAVWHNSSGDWELSWSNGRQLTEANKGSHFISYTYDLAGIRDSKTVDGVTYNYITQNGQVVRQTWGDHVMDFIYDNSGKPYALKYDGTTYYYVLNLQGDVISIITHWGESYGSYTYDAWGNVLSVSGDIANLNPIRYRGYYYDSETRLYYLQSRYYDPQVKRFINADIFASTGQGFIGCNMFAYCNNSPVSSADKTATSASDVAQAWSEGMWWITFLDGPAPVMDSIYVAGVIILFAISLSQSEDDTNDPDVTYPGDDPTQAPDGYEWTGPDEQGGRRGGYKNKDPNKKDSWHPDLNNEKEGPHWDYNDGKGHKWRVYPNGKITPAKSAGVSTIYRLSARTYPKKRSTRIVRVRSVRSMRV